MIQEFIKQNGIDDVLVYDSGFLYEDKKDGFIISFYNMKMKYW